MSRIFHLHIFPLQFEEYDALLKSPSVSEEEVSFDEVWVYLDLSCHDHLRRPRTAPHPEAIDVRCLFVVTQGPLSSSSSNGSPTAASSHLPGGLFSDSPTSSDPSRDDSNIADRPPADPRTLDLGREVMDQIYALCASWSRRTGDRRPAFNSQAEGPEPPVDLDSDVRKRSLSLSLPGHIDERGSSSLPTKVSDMENRFSELLGRGKGVIEGMIKCSPLQYLLPRDTDQVGEDALSECTVRMCRWSLMSVVLSDRRTLRAGGTRTRPLSGLEQEKQTRESRNSCVASPTSPPHTTAARR